jgi:RHS repeat-associated protein
VDSIINTMWKIDATAQNTVWRIHYDRNGRLDTLRVPLPSGSGYSANDYDPASRVLVYRVTGLGADRTQTNTYTPSLPWVTQVTGGPNGQRGYSYDALGQLRTEGTGSSGSTDINAYTYDADGNRLTETGWTYTYNAGRLASRVSGSESITYTYDASGNLTQQDHTGGGCNNPERILRYSADERPVASRRWIYRQQGCRQDIRTYWYDALGRLVLSRSEESTADDWGVTRFWWLDGELAVRLQNYINGPDDFQPQLQRNSSGVLTAFGEWYYPGLGPDQALGSFNYAAGPGAGTGHRHLFLRDWRGSVVTVVEHNGTGPVSRDYEAFGSADAPVKNGPGYNGAPSIDGFQYLRNRWYDPTIGRFTQEDPIGFAGGINLYAYVGSNPLSFSDPFGLKCDKILDTTAPCELFVAAMGEAAAAPNPGAEAAVVVNVLINRALSNEVFASGPGSTRTGDLTRDVIGQLSDPRQIQGNNPNDNNRQDDMARALMAGRSGWDTPGTAQKATAVFAAVESAWRDRTANTSNDPTGGATYYWHGGAQAGPGCTGGQIQETGTAGSMSYGGSCR